MSGSVITPGRMRAAAIVVWIRRELRAQDHLALWSATQDASRVVPVYLVDRAFHASSPAKRLLVVESLRLLREEMRKLGGELFVRRGEAPDVLPMLVRETGAAGVYLTRSYEPEASKAEARLRSLLEGEGKLFRDFKDDVIFERTEILNSSGEPFRIYSAYRRAWMARRDDIAPPLPTLRELDSPSIDPGGLPAGEGTGSPASITVPGAGESAALASLDAFLSTRAGAYRERRDFLAGDGTSRLSHHLSVGSLSPRRLYRAISGRIDGRSDPRGGATSGGRGGIDTFLDQVIWREFYKQILANFPRVDGESFRREFDAVSWRTNVGPFDAWRDGVTGYPVVDAAMRQLKSEGWMHNRGRMIVASFLTRDLHVDWRMGERHFMEHLADGDLALNNGGWQWSAGTGTDPQPWHRIFNPVLQGRKFDPDGSYVKKYVPELSRVPARYVHSPWEMPDSAAREAGVKLGRDYPAPVVDHQRERREALLRYGPGVLRRAGRKSAAGAAV